MYNDIFFREQIFQSDPVFHDEYLLKTLNLPINSRIISKNILEDRITDTTRIIKLHIIWKAVDEIIHNEKLFFKLPTIDKPENEFDRWSRHEIDFYTNVRKADELPIVKCYDAFISEDKKRFLLLLSDISSDYYTGSEIDRNEMDNWFMAAESLAKLHSYYWNSDNAQKLKILHGDDKTLEEKIIHYQNAVKKFLLYASEYYDKEILNSYQEALEDAIIYERASIHRRELNHNISVIHGDSHIFNFMFPKNTSQKPLIVDFQFWRMGIPTIDIMNLARVAFPYMNDPESHLKLIKHYHSLLLEYGVTDYNMDECLYDYYLSTAVAVFGPVFNYYDFGLGHEYWGHGVFDTMNNYKVAKKLISTL
ncbi:MAG: hypothetical protein K0S47_2131 [Herbinix sp.]|jgi:hypothetical protein|nr:hypothetical protein [Herbinix sp.]